MKNYTIFLPFLIFFLVIENSDARPWRYNQIPNGDKFKCENCHVSPAGGGPRNLFGQEVEKNFLSGGDVVWNAELAALDSDGDGFSNGAELQDPEGTWKIGDLNPGDENQVSLPGDPNSTPDPQSVNEIFNYVNDFKVFPNPAVDNTNVQVNLKEPAALMITVYNLFGEPVKILHEMELLAGNNVFEWDLTDTNGSHVPQGRYFVEIMIDGTSRTVKTIDVIR